MTVNQIYLSRKWYHFSVDCTSTTIEKIGFCFCNICSENEGDCDVHDECQDGLLCGSNNCPDHLGFHSEFDCCYAPTVGDENFCTTDNPCGIDEGDCDSSNECQTNLFCDIANSCPAYNGFASDMNCCSNISGSKFFRFQFTFIRGVLGLGRACFFQLEPSPGHWFFEPSKPRAIKLPNQA